MNKQDGSATARNTKLAAAFEKQAAIIDAEIQLLQAGMVQNHAASALNIFSFNHLPSNNATQTPGPGGQTE